MRVRPTVHTAMDLSLTYPQFSGDGTEQRVFSDLSSVPCNRLSMVEARFVEVIGPWLIDCAFRGLEQSRATLHRRCKARLSTGQSPWLKC